MPVNFANPYNAGSAYKGHNSKSTRAIDVKFEMVTHGGLSCQETKLQPPTPKFMICLRVHTTIRISAPLPEVFMTKEGPISNEN